MNRHRMWLGLVCWFAASVAIAGETRTWRPNASGDWHDSANWSDGKLPSDGDDVVIRGESSRATLAKSSPKLGRVEIEGSLILRGWETVLTAQTIGVLRGARIGLPEPFQKQESAHRIQIVSGERLLVAAGAKIDADGRGFAGGVGHAKDDDPQSIGFGPGAGGFPKMWGASAGGSHGGRGGTLSSTASYGSIKEPTQPGSGGGGGNGTGGAGGGTIRIVAKSLVVDGSMSANGGDVVDRNWSGGGSGGSIWLMCDSLGGSGRVEANGGWASVYAGGGGGGRIAIHVANAVRVQPTPTFAALGGGNGRCGVGVEEPKHFGEPGTIWYSTAEIPGRVLPNSGVVLRGDESAPTDVGNRATIAYLMPWLVNSPIATTTKSLHREHPRPRAAARTSREYVGPNIELLETQSLEVLDDVGENITSRWSLDNGRTWSEPVAVQVSNNVKYGDVTVWEGGGGNTYDQTSKRLVQNWLRQIQVGSLYHCFTYSRTSSDLGRTWSTPLPMKYEDGPDFDPQQPRSEKFLNRNEGYPGNNILVHSSGVLIHCLAHTNAAGDPKNDSRPWRMGSRLMLGRWNAERSEYEWKSGASVEISPDQSARGLMEPEVAELRGGRLLVVWRGSDQGWDGTKSKEPGRKWFSISTDAGQTLSLPRPWHYDDGSPFFSASSIHRMIRHRVTGKLYWLGNINAGPPQGNAPRYPLLIAEVDEVSAMLKKATVTLLDDRDPENHDFNYQLSNFSLFENRETHELELFLTTYGQVQGQENWSTADSYRYRLQLKPPE